MQLLWLFALLPCAAAYSLLRTAPNEVQGLACIAVPTSRIVAPGQRATLHLYDQSSLKVLRHAQAHQDGVFGQVVINTTAMQNRQFRVLPVGSRLKVLSCKPSTHTDKFGGSSLSMLAEVLGVGIIEPEDIVQKEPFLAVTCDDDDCILSEPPTGAPAGAATQTISESRALEWHAELAEAATTCQSLDDVASLEAVSKGQGKTSRWREGGTGDWTLAEAVKAAMELRSELRLDGGSAGGDDAQTADDAATAETADEAATEAAAATEADPLATLRLSALASTAHLPGELRLEAMELAQAGQLSALLALVVDALQEEVRRRLAVKALAGLRREAD